MVCGKENAGAFILPPQPETGFYIKGANIRSRSGTTR
jgi:hypothetical protein